MNANGLLLAIPLVLLVLLTLQGRRRGRALREAQSRVTPSAVVMTGVVTRQLANEPHAGFDKGRFTTALSALIGMFAHHYGTEPPGHGPSTSTRGSRNARQR